MAGQTFSGGASAARHIGSTLTAPGATTLICDTRSGSEYPSGQPAGAYLVGYLFQATAAAVVQIRHRNAADAANIWALTVPLPADQLTTVLVPVKDQCAAGESYDAVTVSGPGAAEDVQGGVWCVDVG